MNAMNKPKYESRAAVIKAMAHPTRLFIIDELSKKERCVCELTEMIGDDVSTVSKHLTVLKQAGLVEMDKRGLKVFYSLKTPCILNFFGCVESVLKSQLKQRRSSCFADMVLRKALLSPPQPTGPRPIDQETRQVVRRQPAVGEARGGVRLPA